MWKWLKKQAKSVKRLFTIILVVVVIIVAVVLIAFTFGAGAALLALAIIAAAVIIGSAAASAIFPADDLASALLNPTGIGRPAICYYRGQPFSEGAVLTMEGVAYVCGTDGKWVPAGEVRAKDVVQGDW